MNGILNKFKGRIKQAVGGLTGDNEMKRDGERDERKGKLEAAGKDVKHAAKDVKHAVKAVVKDAKHAVDQVTN
jgi:uncharacterized protein YjbJ (UPF0337 family)